MVSVDSFGVQELAQLLRDYYSKDKEVLTTEATSGGEVVFRWHDDFEGREKVITDSEVAHEYEQSSAMGPALQPNNLR